jgi:hypothetical protein
VWRVVDGKRTRLDPHRSQKLFNHSPDGFEWGYGGSGPAQLALALVLDTLDDDRRAVSIHQDFKFRVVGRMAHERWELSQDSILLTIRASEAVGAWSRFETEAEQKSLFGEGA